MTINTAAIWILTCLAFACLGLAALIMKNPSIVSRGQDAAGKGMAQGCSIFLLIGATTVLGLIAAVSAWRNDGVSLATRIVSTVPVAIVALALATAFVASQIEGARRAEAEEQARLAIPIFLLVDETDQNLSAMYEALRSRYPITEMQLRRPVALHWQLGEHVPRARLICLSVDIPPQPDESGRTNDSRMTVDELAGCKPSGPILLFSRDPTHAQPFAQKLTAAGWSVRVIARTTGDDWFTGAFLTSATELLKDFVEGARP